MARHASRHSSASPPLLTLSAVSPRLALAELPQPAEVFRCRTSSPRGATKSPAFSPSSPVSESHCTSPPLHCLHCRSTSTPAAHLRAERVHLRHHLVHHARTSTAPPAAASPPPPWRQVLAVLARQALGVSKDAARPAYRPVQPDPAAAPGLESSDDAAACPALSPTQVNSQAQASAAAEPRAPALRKASWPPKVGRVRRMPVRQPYFYAVRAIERAAKRAGMASGRISSPTTGLAHVSLRFARRWTRWVELCASAEQQMPAMDDAAPSTAVAPSLREVERAKMAAPGRLQDRHDVLQQDGRSAPTPSTAGDCTSPGQDT